MNPNVTIGRHKLPSRFTSIVRIFSLAYPTDDQLKLIYSSYLRIILTTSMSKHPKWSSNSNIYQLASSMITIYSKVQAKFSRDSYGHYLFTPRELTNWCLALIRYNLTEIQSDSSTEPLLQIWAYEACRIFQDRLVDSDAKKVFMSILSEVLQDEWRSVGIIKNLSEYYYITWSTTLGSSAGRLPPFGKVMQCVKPDFIENLLVKAINRFSKFNIAYLCFNVFIGIF